jgi:predicted nucleotidyltransferase
MRPSLLTRDEAIRRLHTVESGIRRLGVRRLALFGSVLRNEARPDSGVDVLVEFTPSEKSFDRFMASADLLEATLEHPVKIMTAESLSSLIERHCRPRQEMSFGRGCLCVTYP